MIGAKTCAAGGIPSSGRVQRRYGGDDDERPIIMKDVDFRVGQHGRDPVPCALPPGQ
jgi:hypothetical protein